jgi:peptidoglycan/LPS O-acetylase OafA/YrhL
MSTALGSLAVAAALKRKHDPRRTRLVALLAGVVGLFVGGVIFFTYDPDPSQSEAFLPDVLYYVGTAVVVAGIALVTRQRNQ